MSILPADLERTCRRQDDVLTVPQLRAAGLTSGVVGRRVANGDWSSPMRGAYLVPPVRNRFRSVTRAAVLTTGGVVGYETAARLHGLGGLSEDDEAETPRVVVGTHRTRAQRRGVRQHFRRLADDEVTTVAGFRATTPHRTLADLGPRLGVWPLLALTDSALHQGLVVRDELPAQLPDRVLALADGMAESPAESLARYRCVDAGVPPEALQHPVLDGPALVARLDLAWPSRRVALEVDSRFHDAPRALYRDRTRQNRLLNLGWSVLHTTWHDLLTAPIPILVTLFHALGRTGTVKISRL